MTTHHFIRHLGVRGREDQRLARDDEGGFYLFDWSGDSPTTTDDGPLRIELDKPLTVRLDGATATVRNEAGDLRSCGLTLIGAVNLVLELGGWGIILALRFEDDDAQTMMALLELHRMHAEAQS